MPTLKPNELADAIEGTNNVILRWGHGQMRRLMDAEVKAIVAALKAPVSETTPVEFGLQDVLEWADGVRAAQGTELANRITPEEARIAWAITNAPR